MTEVVHEEQGIKIVFWGASLSGKTTSLSIFHAIKKREDPESCYNFLKLEDKLTERTIGFDQATFGLGDKKNGGHSLKYHLFTVPGQDRFKSMRKVVATGLDGLIMVLDSTKAQWDANKESLSELFEILGDKIKNGDIKLALMLNKMDLPADDRISTFDVGKLFVEAGITDEMRDAQANIVETSCLQAVTDLKTALSSGNWDPTDVKSRPISIQRIVQPIQSVIRQVLVYKLSKSR